MNRNLTGVTRLGHVNIVVPDHHAAVAHWRRLFDADFFLFMFVPEVAATNTLGVIGDTCIELFAPYESESTLGRTLAKRGPGVFGLEFTVEDYWQAEQAVLEQGARISHADPGRYFWIHPVDLGGVSIELCPASFENDPRDELDWSTERWAKGPLGITGLRSISIEVTDPPAVVAERFGALFGAEVVTEGSVDGRTVTELVIAGDTYRLIAQRPDGARRAGVASVDFAVVDLEAVREWALEMGLPLVELDHGERLALPAQLNLGSRIEFVASGAGQ